VLVLDMIEILPLLKKYKYDIWRILPVKCYIDNFMRLRNCIRNVNRYLKYRRAGVPLSTTVHKAGCSPSKSPNLVRVYVSCNRVENLTYL
jgi:hypothetical protein